MVAPVKPGDILAEKYRVERILGVGGMGVVVAAEHVTLHQRVALKFMLPDALADDKAVNRFMREARAAAKLRSEHVARVLDVGCLATGAPYIVMEFLEGEDLEEMIKRDGGVHPLLAVDFVLQACMAMAEAHSVGIVHRDLKPANLFVTKRPDGSFQVKVLDFGISKITGGGAELSQTKSSTAMGSPGYMSPEQMSDAKNADYRTDIWALGTILYKLLSNQLPFHANSVPEMFAAVLTGEPTPLATAMPGVDAGLADVVHRCLERDRERRYESVASLAQALVPFGNDKAAHMAASIANVGVALAAAPRADGKPMSMMPTVQARPAAAAAMQAVNESPMTTRRASAGQAVVAAPETGESTPTGRGRLGLILGGVGAAAVVLVVGIKAMSGSGESTAVQPQSGGVVAPADAAPSTPLAISIDAGGADGGAVEALAATDAAPEALEAESPKGAEDAAPRRPRKPKTQTKPTPKPEVNPEPVPTPKPKREPKPKQEPKPKPKPNDDPFGTMQ